MPSAMTFSKPSVMTTETKQQYSGTQYQQKGMLVYETKDRAACSSVKPNSHERKKRNEEQFVISQQLNSQESAEPRIQFNNTLGSPNSNWFPNIQAKNNGSGAVE